jgi:hypothetical protein
LVEEYNEVEVSTYACEQAPLLRLFVGVSMFKAYRKTAMG